jgi:hypothetical protein
MSGWLGTTWEAYGVSLKWSDNVSESFNDDLGEPEQLLPGFGLCIDGRDWSLAYVRQGSVADRLGIAKGSSVVKCQGESVQRRHVRSFFTALRSATELSLAVLRTSPEGKITGFNVVMKVADVNPNGKPDAVQHEPQPKSASGRLPLSALRGSEPNGHHEEGATPAVGDVAGNDGHAVGSDMSEDGAEEGVGASRGDGVPGIGEQQQQQHPDQFQTPRDQGSSTRPQRWTVYTPPAGVNGDKLWQGDDEQRTAPVAADEIIDQRPNGGAAATRSLGGWGSPARAGGAGAANGEGGSSHVGEGPNSGGSGGAGRDGISLAVGNIVAIVKGGGGRVEGGVGTPEWPAPLDAESKLTHSNLQLQPIAVESKGKRKKDGKTSGKKKANASLAFGSEKETDEAGGLSADVRAQLEEADRLRSQLEEAERVKEQQRAMIETLQARLSHDGGHRDSGDDDVGAERRRWGRQDTEAEQNGGPRCGAGEDQEAGEEA